MIRRSACSRSRHIRKQIHAETATDIPPILSNEFVSQHSAVAKIVQQKRRLPEDEPQSIPSAAGWCVVLRRRLLPLLVQESSAESCQPAHDQPALAEVAKGLRSDGGIARWWRRSTGRCGRCRVTENGVVRSEEGEDYRRDPRDEELGENEEDVVATGGTVTSVNRRHLEILL